MAVTVGLFSYGGYLLDQKLSTSPVFLLIGLALGASGGFLHLVNVVAPELLPFRKKDHQPPEPQPPEPQPPEPRAPEPRAPPQDPDEQA